MKSIIILSTTAILLLASCGSKDNAALLKNKKADLEKLKAENEKREIEIKALEAEIAKLDTAALANVKTALVSVSAATTQNFQHFIELQAQITTDNISYIAPRSAGMMAGGVVKELYIQEGDQVKKGQPVLKLDDAIIRQQIAASKEQTKQIKTQLGFARNIYNRQKNLWEQGIGTEVQLLSAKNNVEALENQLQSAEEGIKIQQEQLKTTLVLSDVSGVADEVNIRVGETFTGASAMGAQIKIINTSSLKAVTNVPENYAARIHKGTSVQVLVTDLNKTFNSTLNLLSESIDATRRGFKAEAKIPADAQLRPNQLAVIKILDYAAPNAVVAPVNVVQTDEKGKYLFVFAKLGNGKTVAQKRSIIIGEIYGELVEVKSGLQAGEQIITEGYQNLYEGQLVSLK
ncbi:MAG: hypothetical protein RLY16_493 [Bacteroidota bacterium]|jgi:RND family efflux transporter MFP subunit